jgi:hypothetical protein
LGLRIDVGEASAVTLARAVVDGLESGGDQLGARHHSRALVASSQLLVEDVVEENRQRLGGYLARHDSSRNRDHYFLVPHTGNGTFLAAHTRSELCAKIRLHLAHLKPLPELLDRGIATLRHSRKDRSVQESR